MSLATTNSLVRALALDGNRGADNGNSDIVTVAEEILKIEVAEESSLVEKLVGSLGVAAFNDAVRSAGVTFLGGGNGDRDGGESEDDGLEHFEGWCGGEGEWCGSC